MFWYKDFIKKLASKNSRTGMIVLIFFKRISIFRPHFCIIIARDLQRLGIQRPWVELDLFIITFESSTNIKILVLGSLIEFMASLDNQRKDMQKKNVYSIIVGMFPKMQRLFINVQLNKTCPNLLYIPMGCWYHFPFLYTTIP